MSSPAEFRARHIGGAALAALRAGPATVFASFERSCYVETPSGIACLGGPGLGLGPLNAIVEDFESLPIGMSVFIEIEKNTLWKPSVPSVAKQIPRIGIPESIREPAQTFLGWIAETGKPDDALIGLGPGLTPAGDDFVAGAMIALRAFGEHALADRIAGWALPLAEKNTGKISRAHLRCAAAGEGHEALHDLLSALNHGESAIAHAMQALDRVGHSSGRDAAAGALLSLATPSNVNIAVVY